MNLRICNHFEKVTDSQIGKGLIPFSIEELLHHQILKSKHQQVQAESNDPKICFSNCYPPKISSLFPHSDMLQSLGDD